MPRFFRSLAAPLTMFLFTAGLPALAQEPQTDDAQIDEKVKAEVEKQLKEREAQRWTAGINPQGGGVYVKSPDGQALFRLYGYAQPTFTYTDRDNGATFEETDFRVRRARIDLLAFDEADILCQQPRSCGFPGLFRAVEPSFDI